MSYLKESVTQVIRRNFNCRKTDYVCLCGVCVRVCACECVRVCACVLLGGCVAVGVADHGSQVI